MNFYCGFWPHYAKQASGLEKSLCGVVSFLCRRERNLLARRMAGRPVPAHAPLLCPSGGSEIERQKPLMTSCVCSDKVAFVSHVIFTGDPLVSRSVVMIQIERKLGSHLYEHNVAVGARTASPDLPNHLMRVSPPTYIRNRTRNECKRKMSGFNRPLLFVLAL